MQPFAANSDPGIAESVRLVAGSTTEVARRLVGCILETRIDGLRTAVILDEVEAYGGADDAASHAHRGETARNRSMFLSAGHLYVYLSYGTHHLANIVTGPTGEPGAVLLRSGTPIEGHSVMVRRRGRTDHVADGPGKLAQALGLTLDHDGLRLEAASVSLTPSTDPPRIVATRRVGISKAVELPWRFTLANPT